LTALAGLICWIGAQYGPLDSRQPVVPLGLYALGWLLFVPMLQFYSRVSQGDHSQSNKAEQHESSGVQPLTNRALYWLGGAFFLAVSSVLAQSRQVSILLIFTWLMGIGLIAFALLDGERFWPRSTAIRFIGKGRALDSYLILLLMGAAAWLQFQLPRSTVSPDQGLAGQLGGWFSVLLVPAVYWLGCQVDGRLVGILAAGGTALAEWTHILGQSGEAYSALAFASALYLAALYRALREPTRPAALLAGLLLGVGCLVAPVFIVLSLLVPIGAVLTWLDTRQIAWRRWLAALMLAGVIVLPFALMPRAAPPTLASGYQPPYAFFDGLSSSLLLFNLTSDPNPLHGMVNRPVFPPLLAACFALGLLAWTARLNGARRSRDRLLPLALVISLLPSALPTDLPVSYPDLYRAGLALPVAVVIAGLGATWIIRPLIGDVLPQPSSPVYNEQA
jgi:hypothetical protein